MWGKSLCRPVVLHMPHLAESFEDYASTITTIKGVFAAVVFWSLIISCMSHFLPSFESLIEDNIKRLDWIEVLEHITLSPDISSAVPLSWKIIWFAELSLWQISNTVVGFNCKNTFEYFQVYCLQLVPQFLCVTKRRPTVIFLSKYCF